MEGIRFSTPGFIIHRTIFETVGVFDPKLRTGEDRDMWWRIAMKYPLIGYCYEPCYRVYQDTLGSLTKTTPDRSAILDNILTNIARSQEIGPDVFNTFYPYARRLALDYLIRASGHELVISTALIQRTKQEIHSTLYERMVLGVLETLPRAITRKIVPRLSL
jgi:hypothetical protein